MRITGVDLTPVFSRRETGDISRHVIVRLSTDEGLEGLGEMSDVGDWGIMYDLTDMRAAFETLLVGKDPLEWKPITIEAGERLMGGAMQAGFEIALFDLIGKYRGQTIAGLFGGSLKDRLRVCYPIFRNYSAEDAQENVKRVERRMGEGHDLFRLYHGGNVDADEVFLDAVRSQWGDAFKLKSLDFSRRFKWKRVVHAADRLLQFYTPIHLESVSDIRDRDGQYEIRKRIDLPISEHISTVEQAFEFAKHRYVDIFNICLCGAGGLTRALHIAQVAHAAGLSCLVGTTQELSIGVAAQGMFGSVLENLDYPADCTGGLLYEHDVVVDRVRYEKGHLIVPEGPGVGMELDADKLAQFTYPLSSVNDPEI